MKSLYTTACAAAILAALSFPQAAKALEFSVSNLKLFRRHRILSLCRRRSLVPSPKT